MLGVDGCPAGWVGILLASGRLSLWVGPTIEALLARLPTTPEVVGIDIPIGLPDTGSREADRLARVELPPGRKSSVFPTPARAAVLADTWPEANEANRAATGKGLSHQGFNLCRKIAEVDDWVRSGPGPVVIEVHPEVSFTALGADTRLPKKTALGAEIRVAALAAAGLTVPAAPYGAGVGRDDVLDACAVAWTARRHLRGGSRRLPEVAQRFSDGLPAAIHV